MENALFVLNYLKLDLEIYCFCDKLGELYSEVKKSKQVFARKKMVSKSKQENILPGVFLIYHVLKLFWQL